MSSKRQCAWVLASCLSASAAACSPAEEEEFIPGDSLAGDPAGGDGDGDASGDVSYEDYDAVVTIAATCPAHTPCGNDISGKWFYTGVCHVEDELFAAVYESCQATQVSNVVPQDFTGWVQFQGGAMTRDIHAVMTADLAVPTSCTFGFCDCGTVENVINQTEGLAATCDPACVNNACECAVTFTVALTDGGTYTTSGNQVTITTQTNMGQKVTTYDYCAHATELTYEDAASADPESGTYTLRR